jgi:hypothetical protein
MHPGNYALKHLVTHHKVQQQTLAELTGNDALEHALVESLD